MEHMTQSTEPLCTINDRRWAQCPRCGDAEIKRCPRNRLASKYRARRLVYLTHEGRCAETLNKPRMKEMDHATTVGDIDPALYQLSLSAADKAKIFEGNARRIYGRLSRVIEKQSAR